jgi:hypothetical protein
MSGCDAVISLFAAVMPLLFMGRLVQVTEKNVNVFSGLKRVMVGYTRDSDENSEAGRHVGGSANRPKSRVGIPCYFSKNSLLAGNSKGESSAVVRVGRAQEPAGCKSAANAARQGCRRG